MNREAISRITDPVLTCLLGRFSWNHVLATVDVLLSILSILGKTKYVPLSMGSGGGALCKAFIFKVIRIQMRGSFCELDIF